LTRAAEAISEAKPRAPPRSPRKRNDLEELNPMFDAIDSVGRTAAAVGLAAALMLLPLGVAVASGASADGAWSQAAVSAAGPVAAQGPGAGTPPGSKSPGAKAKPAPAGPRDEVEQEITQLRDRLHITPAQQQQFDAFAEILRKNAQALDALMHEKNPKANAVEDMRFYLQFTEAQAEGLKQLLPAFQALYDSLSDQQKRAADAVMGNAAQPGEPRQGRPPG
jgi:periplasmic protein CpxP/Spy